ncbi:hypothetical protein MTO96_037344 [Rhipicephalus appendiculatus]
MTSPTSLCTRVVKRVLIHMKIDTPHQRMVHLNSPVKKTQQWESVNSGPLARRLAPAPGERRHLRRCSPPSTRTTLCQGLGNSHCGRTVARPPVKAFVS